MNARLAGLGALLLLTALVPASTAAAEDTKTGAGTVPNFTGHWRLNKELSDKPQALPTPAPKKDAGKKGEASAKDAKTDAPAQADSAKSDAAKPDAAKADSAKADAAKPDSAKTDAAANKAPDPGKAFEPPADAVAEFTVSQTDVEVAAKDNAGQTRSFYPNGKTYKADEGASTVKTEWKEGALVFEKKNTRGWKYTETWKLLPDGRLRLDTHIEGGHQKAASTKRIYDKVPDGK